MTCYLRGQVSNITGLGIETLRYYENNELIPAPNRTSGGYRVYTDDILNRLEFIKLAKHAGFKLEEIKKLLLIIDNKIPDEQIIADLLEKKINDISREISELDNMRSFLVKVKDNIKNPNKCHVLNSLLKY